MTRHITSALAVFCASGLLSCATDETPVVSASVHALNNMGLPTDANCLEIEVLSGGESNSRRLTVDGLMDRDENGRRESIIGSGELPAYGTPFEIRIEARTGADGGCGAEVPGGNRYKGTTGSIRLRAGERRVLNIALYEVGATEFLTRGTEVPPRFLHTSTPLGDGRVLIAGGFDSLVPTDCPAEVTAESCFEAEAASDAYVFDSPSGEFYAVQGGMLAARGGHTATELSDGRVLITGGAESAIVAMTRGERPSFRILPLRGRFLQAHASFEFFTRGFESPSDDPQRRGLPGRGNFEGPSSDPSAVGALNNERFLHAAASIDGLRVLLAGGTGAGSPSTTFEVFDLLRPGGEGVNSADGDLLTPREMPTAFVLNGAVWIYGGGTATSDLDLAEVWDGGMPVGRTLSATERGFNLSAGDHPELALLQPQIVANSTGDKALVTGWYGPRCDALGDDPARPTYEGLDLHRCGEPPATMGTPQRNFFISDSVTAFQPASNRNQAFASAVRLDNPDSVIVLGGMRSGEFETRVDVLGFRFDTEGFLGESALMAQRAFHRSTVVPGIGILTTGGLGNTGGTLLLTATTSEMLTLTAEGMLR